MNASSVFCLPEGGARSTQKQKDGWESVAHKRMEYKLNCHCLRYSLTKMACSFFLYPGSYIYSCTIVTYVTVTDNYVIVFVAFFFFTIIEKSDSLNWTEHMSWTLPNELCEINRETCEVGLYDLFQNYRNQINSVT